MMDECREGDATEAVSRSPERPTAGQGVEAWQDAPKEEQQQQQTLVKNAESKEVSKGDAQTNDTPTDPCQAPPLDPEGGSSSSSGSNSSVAWEETRDQLPVKTETRQVAEASCYGEKIEEVIRRIESKTRVVREKAGSEGPSLEPKKSSTSTLGSGKVNSASPALAMERKEVELQGKEGSRIKTNEGDTGQAGTPHPVTEGTTSQPVKPSTGTTTAVTSPSVDAKTTEKKEVKAVSQRIVVLSNTSALARRKVKVVRAAATDEPRDEPAKETSHAGHGVTPMANGTVAAPQEAEKLKRMEKDYKEKKNVVNKLKMQLANLLNEVKEEQRQRHELKKSVGELRARLKDMETQLESKSSSVQTKIEVVRRLQQQTHKEQQALIQLEHQGERIGKRIHGNGYSFPMVLPSSPNSKTKEAHIAKSLASSIAALQQQMRNLAKRKNNLASGVTNGGETRVVRALTLDPKKESIAGATGNEKSEKAAPQVSQGKAPPDPAGKPQGKAGAAVVKRKLVSSGVVGSAKVAKVEVPMESSAIQERRVPSVTVPIKPKDDKLVEEKLDEMKALCPHDLLGRCNDSACQYQHLPSARPSLPPATRGSLSGADPPTASAVKRASDVKTGAGVKIVPRGSDVKGGFTAAGRTVRVAKATKTVVKAVACESSVRQVTGSSVSGPEQTVKIPVTETHATPHQTNTLTATHPHTPATHHTDTHANTNTQTPPTHQQTQTHTSQETETHTTTHTHQLTEAQDSRELFTLQNDTATPRATEDETESHTETHSEAKDSEGTIEPQDQSEIQTQMPSTAPQESEMQETHAEEGRKDTALQNKAAFKTLSDPQTQTTTYREINTEKPGETRTPAGEGTETQGSVDNAGQEWKATDDKLSSSNTTVTETEVKTEKPVKAVQADTCTDSREEAETQDLLHTAEGELKAPEEEGLSASTAVEDKPSDNTPGMPQKPSKTTKSRVTRSRTVTKSNAEDTVPSDSQDTDLEKQSVDSVEEEVCTDNQDTRPTRKSPRVRAKTTPKSRTSFDATRTSPRSNKKRKSDNGQRSVKNAKRRASTRL